MHRQIKHGSIHRKIKSLTAKTSQIVCGLGLSDRDWIELFKPFGFALWSLDHGQEHNARQNLESYAQKVVGLQPRGISKTQATALVAEANGINSLIRLQHGEIVKPPQPIGVSARSLCQV